MMTCEEANIYYYDYLSGDGSVPEAILAHFEQCEHCRDEIERLRQMLAGDSARERSSGSEFIALHYELLDRWVSCAAVRPLLASLLLADFSVHHATPVTAHLEHCAQCQQDMEAIASLKLNSKQLLALSRCLAGEDEALSSLGQAAESLLRDMRSRADGEVLTYMRLTEKPEGATEGTWLSDAYTIDVKRISGTVGPVRRRLAVPAFLTSGIAAAILLVVLLLVVPSEKVQALDLSQVYQGVATVQNVHIRFLSEDLQETQSIWISETLAGRMFQQYGQTVFWDERTGDILRKEGGSVQFVSHFDEAAKMERPWGLLPFERLSELPVDKEWTYLKDTKIRGITVQVYELTWPVSDGQVVTYKTWRGYLDVQTHLPYRIEWVEKIDNDPSLIMFITEVRYPTEEECRNVFLQEGFRISFYGVQTDLLVMTP